MRLNLDLFQFPLEVREEFFGRRGIFSKIIQRSITERWIPYTKRQILQKSCWTGRDKKKIVQFWTKRVGVFLSFFILVYHNLQRRHAICSAPPDRTLLRKKRKRLSRVTTLFLDWGRRSSTIWTRSLKVKRRTYQWWFEYTREKYLIASQ